MNLFFLLSVFISACVFNCGLWPKTALPLWLRDAKMLGAPALESRTRPVPWFCLGFGRCPVFKVGVISDVATMQDSQNVRQDSDVFSEVSL